MDSFCDSVGIDVPESLRCRQQEEPIMQNDTLAAVDIAKEVSRLGSRIAWALDAARSTGARQLPGELPADEKPNPPDAEALLVAAGGGILGPVRPGAEAGIPA
jgi:hypothetical protein